MVRVSDLADRTAVSQELPQPVDVIPMQVCSVCHAPWEEGHRCDQVVRCENCSRVLNDQQPVHTVCDPCWVGAGGSPATYDDQVDQMG